MNYSSITRLDRYFSHSAETIIANCRQVTTFFSDVFTLTVNAVNDAPELLQPLISDFIIRFRGCSYGAEYNYRYGWTNELQ